MINLLQETKKKVEKKIFSPDFQNSTEDQFLPQHFIEKLAAVPAENILKSEANIGLLGREDECECLSELFFMRAHGIIHDAAEELIAKWELGKGIVTRLKTQLSL